MNTAQRPLGAFEERLLAELKDVLATRAGAAARVRPDRAARSPHAWWPPRVWPQRLVPVPGWLRRVAVAGALSVALAAGLLVSGTVTVGGRSAPASTADAATFLHHAAAAARVQGGPAYRPGQWFYVVERVVTKTRPGPRFGALCIVVWSRTDGLPALFEIDPGLSSAPLCAVPRQQPPAAGVPGYRYHYYPDPRSLPTDPAALLARLRQEAARGAGYWGTSLGVSAGGLPVPMPVPAAPHGRSHDDIVLKALLIRLLQAPVPAGLRAALFEVAARIPAVTLARDAVDAIGRHGVAIAWDDAAGMRTELIIDAHTYRVLGARIALLNNGREAGFLGAGTVSAVLRSGVVSSPRP